MSRSAQSASAFVVAVTGGVASGKTAVAQAFARRGIHTYDADIAAREAVAAGGSGLAEIVTAFGQDILQDDGSLDRAAMRRRIFADPSARATLEAIVHPRVRERLHAQVNADAGPYCLLAVPLLAETWPAYAWVDRVLVVDVSPDLQHQRLLQRDAVSPQLADQMIAAQASREQRLGLASDVLDNSGSLAELDDAVARLHASYLALSQRKNSASGPTA